MIKVMPADEKGQFTFPGPNGTRVGEKVFFINEDPCDGAPTLKQALKERSGFNGLPIQDVYPHFAPGNLQSFDITPFYPTAEGARDGYIALARHRLAEAFDPNRPGDVAQRAFIQENLDSLLALDWEKAVAEARTALETVLAERKWGKMHIPVQGHLIGETIIGDDGKEVEVADVELVDQDGEIGIGMAESLRVIYKDSRGRVIKLSPKTV